MLEKLRNCLIFFIVSDAIFGVALFFACYNFFRSVSKRFAFYIYIIMTVLILFASIHISFFVDSYDPDCKKLYKNKVLYTINIGESKTLKEIMERDVRVCLWSVFDGASLKERDDILSFRIDLGSGAYEEVELELGKKEIINVDEDVFKAKYKKTSNIAITRDGEKTFSIRLINKENVIFDYQEEDDEVTKSLKAKVESLQKELEPQE